MIPFDGATTKTFSQIEPGNLFVLDHPGADPTYALRVELKQSRSSATAIILDPAEPPTFIVEPDSICLDLGRKAAIRVLDEATEFSTIQSAAGPGDLLVHESAIAIIALVPRATTGPRQIIFEVSTGQQVVAGGDPWFVKAWQLGIDDGRQFHKLYEWPHAQKHP